MTFFISTDGALRIPMTYDNHPFCLCKKNDKYEVWVGVPEVIVFNIQGKINLLLLVHMITSSSKITFVSNLGPWRHKIYLWF